MLLLSWALCRDRVEKSTGGREKLCLRGICVFTALSASPVEFIRRGSPSLCAKPVPLKGEKRKQRGNLVPDIFHQVLTLLQALERNPGDSFSQSISCCYSLIWEGRESWRPDAGDQQWGQCPRPPAATHSRHVFPARSLEARQAGQALPLLAVGSNSYFLYKTHQNVPFPQEIKALCSLFPLYW